MINDIVKSIILNGVFIFGSILFLYCLAILWARRSYRKAQNKDD